MKVLRAFNEFQGTPPILGVGDVHLWYIDLDRCADLASCENYRHVLSADEIKYAENCSEGRQREFLVTRGTLRILLSRYLAATQPNKWIFSQNEFGRPTLAKTDEPLVFNVSHASGLAVIAFSRSQNLGVDIERCDRNADFLAIAESHFAATEYANLLNTSVDERRKKFFQYWTLKEAFIKAVGLGLSLPLDSFAFKIEDGLRGSHVEIDIDSRRNRFAGNWTFSLFKPQLEYQVALAIRDPATHVLNALDLGFPNCFAADRNAA